MVKEIVGNYAYILGSSYEEYGLGEGSLVFIAGSGFSPIDEDDNFKLLFVVTKTDNGVPVGERGVTIARKSLQVCSDEEQATYKKNMEEVLEREAEATNETE